CRSLNSSASWNPVLPAISPAPRSGSMAVPLSARAKEALMQQQTSAVRAAIDIGSNTIEVLVARCLPGDMEIIEHQSTMARLGESVDESGEISRDKFKVALDTVRKYEDLAKKRGAEQILALATEAMREARNSQDFL